jgi:hypothetical protein
LRRSIDILDAMHLGKKNALRPRSQSAPDSGLSPWQPGEGDEVGPSAAEGFHYAVLLEVIVIP